MDKNQPPWRPFKPRRPPSVRPSSSRQPSRPSTPQSSLAIPAQPSGQQQQQQQQQQRQSKVVPKQNKSMIAPLLHEEYLFDCVPPERWGGQPAADKKPLKQSTQMPVTVPIADANTPPEERIVNRAKEAAVRPKMLGPQNQTKRKNVPAVRRFISQSPNKPEKDSQSPSKSSTSSASARPKKKSKEKFKSETKKKESVMKSVSRQLPKGSREKGTKDKSTMQPPSSQKSVSRRAENSGQATPQEEAVTDKTISLSAHSARTAVSVFLGIATEFNEEEDTRICRAFRLFGDKCNKLTIPFLKRQFRDLERDTQPTKEACQAYYANPSKNRYSDVHCLDVTRVKLENEESDYIHANHVSSPLLRNPFILTQGPLTKTVWDFWRMVIQEHAEYIFMLCKCVEKNRKKSAEYLPQENRPLDIGNITLSQISREVTENGSLIKTHLSIESRDEYGMSTGKTLTHIQWLDWPDCDIPDSKEHIPYQLLATVRGIRRPTVVHCSAGIGRSGTLIALEMALMEVAKGNALDLDTVVRELRKRRAQAVQTFEQFLFLHHAVVRFGVDYKAILQSSVDRFERTYRDHFATRPRD